MSKKIILTILSRKEIEVYRFTVPSIAICIAYPNGRLHKIFPQDNLLAVFHTRFSDCDEKGIYVFEKKDPPLAIPMTRGQAVDILDFVKKWKEEIEEIVIACYGGMSRSAGIGAGLAAIYGWDDRHIYRTKQPNAWCKTLLLREWAQRAVPANPGRKQG